MIKHTEDFNENQKDKWSEVNKNKSLVSFAVKRWALSRMFLLDQQDRAEDSTALKNEFQI